MCDKDLHRLKHCRIGQRDLSDHSGIFLTLHLDGRQRKTLWRFNTGLLNDHTFRNSMEKDLALYMQDNNNGEVNPSILWDAAKAVLRGKIIARTAALKKMKTQKLTGLQEKLRDLEQIHITNNDPSIIQQIRHTKQEIDQILGEEVEKKIRFMKQRYYEAGPGLQNCWLGGSKNNRQKTLSTRLETLLQIKLLTIWMAYKKHLKDIINLYTLSQNRLITTQRLNF